MKDAWEKAIPHSTVGSQNIPTDPLRNRLQMQHGFEATYEYTDKNRRKANVEL